LRAEAAELSAIFNQSQLTATSNAPARTPNPKSHNKFVNS
jgi:hypothetical protein